MFVSFDDCCAIFPTTFKLLYRHRRIDRCDYGATRKAAFPYRILGGVCGPLLSVWQILLFGWRYRLKRFTALADMRYFVLRDSVTV
uniref:RDD domain-containing protein n=1 Tax=Angiostrongylus cantonensis TaxID=6313 RepID=A0A0K0D977_ANGCA